MTAFLANPVTAPLARLAVLVGACTAIAVSGPGVAACSSDPDELSDPDLPPVTESPDGLSYPSDHIGSRKRSQGRAGDRMPNLTLRAYRNGRGGGLETVSLAEFFDPQQRRNKVLYLQVAATWCAICSGELEASMSVAEPLKERGVVLLEVVISGETAGKGPSQPEVEDWIDRHHTSFPTAIDVRGRRLASLGVSPSAVPYDFLIDTRTMEILDSSVGAPLDVGKYSLQALDFVTKNPPSYP